MTNVVSIGHRKNGKNKREPFVSMQHWKAAENTIQSLPPTEKLKKSPSPHSPPDLSQYVGLYAKHEAALRIIRHHRQNEKKIKAEAAIERTLWISAIISLLIWLW